MRFSTKKHITSDYLPNKIITYIAKDDDLLLEIKAKRMAEYGLEVLSTWYIPNNVPTLLDCYHLIQNEIETYVDIDYEVAMGSKKRRIGNLQERKIPFHRLDRTLNPLTLARPNDIAIVFNSNYGAFWLEGEPIIKGAESIKILSPFNLAKIVSQLILKTNLIEPEERREMETILDLSYDYYLNNDRNKMTIIR